MYKITKKTKDYALKVFDVVSPLDQKHSIGFITEVSFNDHQEDPEYQIDYSVEWLNNNELHNAWFEHGEIKFLGKNIFKIIEENMSNKR